MGTVAARKRRFPIAEYNKMQKRRREELINSRLETNSKLETVSKEVHKLQQRLSKKTKQVFLIIITFLSLSIYNFMRD